MRQTVGSLIQFRVAYPGAFTHHCDGIRGACRLLLEQLVDALILGILHLGVVPFHQQLMPFRFAQQIDPVHLLPLIGHHRFQNPAQVSRMPLDRAAVEQ